jgi:hypothetical protein
LGDIAILDTRHGNTLTVLSAANAGQGASRYRPQEPALTTDGVAWVAVAQRDGQWTTEVWASTLAARSARLVATLPGQTAVASPMMAWVVGDRVVFDGMTAGQPGPMYWVPRSGGGQPKAIPGSQGRWPVTGGWTSTNPIRFPGSNPGHEDPSLFNVLTGARVPIRRNPGFQISLPNGHALLSLSCAPSWCFGRATGTDGTHSVAVQHPDGTGYTEAGPFDPIAVFGGGRFVVGYVDLGNDRVQDFIWDVVTGAPG